MIQLFQQRDFSNKINATFQYLAQNFRSLGASLLYIVGPVALVSGIATGLMQSDFFKLGTSMGDNDDPIAMLQMISQFTAPTFWLASLFSMFANVAVILTTYAHMKVYDRVKGGPITVADVWATMQPIIGPGILISILNSIIIFIGFVFFLIPGLYLAVALSISLAVTSFEGTDFGATWNRCFQLIRDKWWSTFGLIVIVGIIVAIAGMIFAVPTFIVTALVSAKFLPDISTGWLIIASIISIIGRTLLNVVIYTAIGFQYTNLVERQEGRGIQSAIDSIGTSPTLRNDMDDDTY